MPKVMTANLLRSGDVVYLAGDGQWVVDLAEAAIASGASEAAQLESAAEAAIARQEIVSAYLFDVALEGDRPVAKSVHEKIRAARGPSVI